MANDKSQIDRVAWSVDEWCERHGFKRGTYYNLRKVGKAPRIHYAMSKPLISREADDEWMRERELEALAIAKQEVA